MIPDPNEVARSLRGALRLLCRDPGGLQDFNMTEQGFWRSFFAVVIATPMSVCADLVLGEPWSHSVVAMVIRSEAYLVFHWLAFVLLMFHFTRFMDLTGRFTQFVTAHNWCAVVSSALYLVPALFHAFGVVSLDLAFLALFLLLPVWLAYSWFVARVTLETSGGVAASVVAIEFFLAILIGAMLELF